MTYNTIKRNELIRFLSANVGQAFSVEEICSNILTNGGGKSTVYRLVSKLWEEGLVRRVFNGKSRTATYQYIDTGACSEHFHLKCNLCGRLIHLNGAISHALESKILKSEGFSLESGGLLYGMCGECKTGGASEK